MKFPTENGSIVTLRVHQMIVQECYAANLKISLRYRFRKKEVNAIAGNIDFDPTPNYEPQVESRDEIIPW